MAPRITVAVLAALVATAPRVASAEGERDVLVLAFTERDPRAAAPEDAGWLPSRLADLVEERLRRLGVDVRERRFVDAHGKLELGALGLGALVRGRVRPEVASEPSVRLELELEVRTPSGAPLKQKLTAPAGELDRLATDVALVVAERTGRAVTAAARARLAEVSTPFTVHRLLGIARTHLDLGSFRKAMVMFDRAAELTSRTPMPEAFEGRLRAEAELVGRGEATFGARAELAPPAAERADVALKQGDDAGAQRALDAFLRYTPERALRWSVEAPLVRGDAVLIARGNRWVLQHSAEGKGRWSIDPRTGSIVAEEPSVKGLVGLAGGHVLALDGRVLLRLDEAGQPKWKTELPGDTKGLVADAIDLTSGLAGIMGAREVSWVETSFGSLGQQATGVRPLASGTIGILVELEPAPGAPADTHEIALLRPGKRTPTWTAKVGAPLDAALTQDRVLVVTPAGLVLLRAHDGREAGKVIELGPEARIVGADGRSAVVALDATRAALVDVLSAEQTATLTGPGRAVGAYTAARGAAVLYATGDLITFDRDGALLDRAKVPGEPIQLVRGSPMAPGPVAMTTRGLWAFAEVPVDTTSMRDVDALLKLAAVLDRQKESALALRLVEGVARASVGRVERAERLRAELLERRGDAASV
ncbi:hypothetical protein L6R52_43010, partial [Myxococcota bacterium]|nr:hypothetical protein [Myxococcota bacterium]